MENQPPKKILRRFSLQGYIIGIAAYIAFGTYLGKEEREDSRAIANTEYVLKSTSIETLLGKDFEQMRQTLKKRIREQDNAMWQSAYRHLENQRRMEDYTNSLPSIIFTR